MPLTPRQVKEDLSFQGREVSARALTDFRSRGLLPRLKPRGRGQGKGKENRWHEPNILDQAAFVADLRGWDTPRVVFALWCCGFEVYPDDLKAALRWSVECLSHFLTREDMNQAPAFASSTYFEALEDILHPILVRSKVKIAVPQNAISRNWYSILQFALKLLLAEQIPPDASEEIDQLNELFAASAGIVHPRLDIFATVSVLRFRRIVNVFAMRAAIAGASKEELNRVEQGWSTICRFCSQFMFDKELTRIGFTEARGARLSFGIVVMPCLLAVTRTDLGQPLMSLFATLRAYVDRLDRERAAGEWLGREGCQNYLEKVGPEMVGEITRSVEDIYASFQRFPI